LRSPAFTVIAVLSLALGIRANTAIFTLIKQLLLQNLSVRDPQQLVTWSATKFQFGRREPHCLSRSGHVFTENVNEAPIGNALFGRERRQDMIQLGL
jgi:hypothetical protein